MQDICIEGSIERFRDRLGIWSIDFAFFVVHMEGGPCFFHEATLTGLGQFITQGITDVSRDRASSLYHRAHIVLLWTKK